MCKHNWVLALPLLKDIEENKRANYAIETCVFGSRILRRTYYCGKCKRSGHAIHSGRGGIRLHKTDYFMTKANEIREKYGLPLLSNEQTVQPSAATKLNSSNAADPQNP